MIGLVVGKGIGIVGLSWIARRIGLTSLPTGIGWRQVSIVGLCGGIGFTMALFIAQLAFPRGALLETAKLGILCASATAGTVAYVVGRVALNTSHPAGAKSASEAEASTTV